MNTERCFVQRKNVIQCRVFSNQTEIKIQFQEIYCCGDAFFMVFGVCVDTYFIRITENF